jgi:hypothetical protein
MKSGALTTPKAKLDELKPPCVVACPERFSSLPHLGQRRYLRFPNFLRLEVAEALYQELCYGLKYERVNIANVTRQWRGERELGDAYFGNLQTREGWHTPELVNACYELFAHPWFVDLLSRIAGSSITFLRPATPYCLKNGDRICLHDDLSDSRHRISVVLSLTKNWRREYGGNTVIGQVLRTEELPTPPHIPFQLRRWFVGRSKSILTPRFNSLLVIRLGADVAHGVTQLQVSRPRLSLVNIYGAAR